MPDRRTFEYLNVFICNKLYDRLGRLCSWCCHRFQHCVLFCFGCTAVLFNFSHSAPVYYRFRRHSHYFCIKIGPPVHTIYSDFMYCFYIFALILHITKIILNTHIYALSHMYLTTFYIIKYKIFLYQSLDAYLDISICKHLVNCKIGYSSDLKLTYHCSTPGCIGRTIFTINKIEI